MILGDYLLISLILIFFFLIFVDPETHFVAKKLIKKIKSQLPINNSKVIAAIQEPFYNNFTFYDLASKGLLHLWLFSGLTTGNTSVFTCSNLR